MSTSKTYSAQLSAFLKICVQMQVSPTPLSPANLGRYIAFLSSISSVKQYLNVVRLLHLEAGFPNPLEKNWYVTSILKGVRRVKGDTSTQTLPITIDILKQIFLKLDFHSSLDRTFWATCLVGFFSFFSFALQCGLHVDLIKIQGDWKSNACEHYLQPSFQLRKQVANTMGASFRSILASD